MITRDLISRLGYPGMSAETAQIWAVSLSDAFNRYGITTPLQQAHVLAQIMHESGGLRYTREIWGPTPAQVRYEGRADLGNTQPGDGARYMGRGPIQLTGRGNYRAAGKELDLPLEAQPELVERPGIGALVAARYMARKTLAGRTLLQIANDGPDDATVRLISIGVNGRNRNGEPNHLPERLAAFRVAWAALKTPPVLKLVPKGGGDPVNWDGTPALYGGVPLSAELVDTLRRQYPAGGARAQYLGVYVYHRRNGDVVLERVEDTK